jgi:hypothetical protein
VTRRLAAVLVAGLLLAACGSDDDDNDAAATSTTTTTAVTTTTTATPEPEATCSASELSAGVDAEDGLPAPVAAMRADLAHAAATCDWDALAALADRDGAAVRYTFGEGNDPIPFWKAAEANDAVPPLRALRVLLDLPYAASPMDNGPTQYVWPAAFAEEHPTEAHLQEIVDSGLYDRATLQGWIDSGMNYLGYRIIITGTGDWTAFVEGD